MKSQFFSQQKSLTEHCKSIVSVGFVISMSLILLQKFILCPGVNAVLHAVLGGLLEL